MLRKPLMLSLLLMLSAGAHASKPKDVDPCAKDKQSAVCQAYIAGLVEGYISSKQKYVATKADLGNSYLNRAFASRAGRIDEEPLAKPACLPLQVNKTELVEFLSAQSELPKQELPVVLGQHLRSKYAC